MWNGEFLLGKNNQRHVPCWAGQWEGSCFPARDGPRSWTTQILSPLSSSTNLLRPTTQPQHDHLFASRTTLRGLVQGQISRFAKYGERLRLWRIFLFFFFFIKPLPLRSGSVSLERWVISFCRVVQARVQFLLGRVFIDERLLGQIGFLNFWD